MTTRQVGGYLIPHKKKNWKKANWKDTLAPASSPCQWMGCTKGASWGIYALGWHPLMSPTHLNAKNRKLVGWRVTWKGPAAPNLYVSCEFKLYASELNGIVYVKGRPTESLDARFQQFIHSGRLLQRRRLHRSSFFSFSYNRLLWTERKERKKGKRIRKVCRTNQWTGGRKMLYFSPPKKVWFWQTALGSLSIPKNPLHRNHNSLSTTI